MRFEGPALIEILRRQKEPVQICNAAGVPYCTVPAAVACGASLPPKRRQDVTGAGFPLRGFVGVGNKRRIRYLQAINGKLGSVGWRGRDGTRPARADPTCRIYRDGQLMGEKKSHREFMPVSTLKLASKAYTDSHSVSRLAATIE